MATTLDSDDPSIPPAASSHPDTVPDPLAARRRRLRAAWAAGLFGVLLLAGVAIWLVKSIAVDRSLHAVGKAAVLTPALPAAPVPPVAPAAASLAPDETLVDPSVLAPAAATAVAATALPAVGGQGAARPAGKADNAETVRKPRKKTAPRRQAHAADPRDRTFVRCPPLGKAGAVMCRWHVCNGGAGKEAACRPYLERKP